MATLSVSFCLVVSARELGVARDAFVDVLEIQLAAPVTEIVCNPEPWGSTAIWLGDLVLQEASEEASAQFDLEVRERCAAISGWLERIPRDRWTEVCIAARLVPRLVVQLAIDQDQMEFAAPPALLSALGSKSIGLEVLSDAG